MRPDLLYTYFMNLPQFAITWSIFFGAGLLSFAIQLYRNRNLFSLREMVEHCVPFDPWRSKSFHMDVIIYVHRKFTDFLFATPGVVIAGLVSIGVSMSLTTVFGNVTPIPTTIVVTFICTILMFLAAEFADYLVHYLEHKVPALWELHKVHHSADFLNPLTSKRGHSLPILYGGAIAGVITGATGGIFIFVFDISLPEALVLKTVASKIFTIWTLDPLKHSHIPVGLGWFDRFLISPHMHQVHHSKLQQHWDKNFGTNLSIFDWIFGTGYQPAKGEKVEFGIAGYSDATLQKFNTLRGAFINPIIRSAKVIQKRFQRKPDAVSPLPSDGGSRVVAASRGPKGGLSDAEV